VSRCVLALSLLLTFTAAEAGAQLRYLGQQIVPSGYRYAGTEVGGLSGLDFDPGTGTYFAISDDRSSEARFYTLTLDLSQFNRKLGPGMSGVRFAGVHPLLDENGQRFADRTVDPESIRLHPQARTLVWSSEGDPRKDVIPFVREMDTSGAPRRTFALPAQFSFVPGRAHGVRNNLAFESVAITPSGSRVVAASENALAQDGPQASTRSGSSARVVVFDHASGKANAQYVYPVEPVVSASLLPHGLETNGLTELLALDEDAFIALERSFSAGNRLSIRLYLTNFSGATDVTRLESLEGATFQPMRKRLLLDLTDLTNDDGSPLWLENIEAVSFGPTLANGNRTLVLVADNNFQGGQQTQFLAFEILGPLR